MKKLRRKNFAYDAPAQFATYITPDCHFWRTDYENVKKMASDRNKMANQNTFGNLDKLLKVTVDFYDAVDYAHFYKTYSKFYKRLLQLDKTNADLIKNIKINYAEYFHQPMDRTVLNFSIFEDNNNYGCHFYDGEKSYFEPKYVAEMVKEYESEEYYNFEDFETRLTELYIQKFCNEN